jgi:hypothetical protein
MWSKFEYYMVKNEQHDTAASAVPEQYSRLEFESFQLEMSIEFRIAGFVTVVFETLPYETDASADAKGAELTMGEVARCGESQVSRRGVMSAFQGCHRVFFAPRRIAWGCRLRTA